MSEWISVDERLPEFYTEVLIAFADCSLPATGQLVRKVVDPGETEWIYPAENSGDGFNWEVTHWMPLPPPPRGRPKIGGDSTGDGMANPMKGI